MTTIVGHTS